MQKEKLTAKQFRDEAEKLGYLIYKIQFIPSSQWYKITYARKYNNTTVSTEQTDHAEKLQDFLNFWTAR